MRIVTRPDFDGIVCAVLLRHALDIRTRIYWVEPGEVQQGSAEIRSGDILANLPHDPRCSLWFDHHVSNTPSGPVAGAHALAPSAAGVIYGYYRNQNRLDDRFDELVVQTDIIDSASLTREQVNRPEDFPYILLSMTVTNPGTGEEEAYWNHLVDLLETQALDQVMADSEVASRCAATVRKNQDYTRYLQAHTVLDGPVSLVDQRGEASPVSGNRFTVYALFPETWASVKIRYDARDASRVLVSVGRSIFNTRCRVNVGHLLSRYSGGGHAGAGGCTLDAATADTAIREIVGILKDNLET